MDLVDILKALSDETRLRILNLLRYGELCVCEIEKLLNLTQSNASRHLTRLNNSKLIINTKKQQYVYYKINSEILEKYDFIKDVIYNELAKNTTMKDDYEKLIKFKNDGKGCNNLN